MGGHLVTGHVDGPGVLRERKQGPEHLALTFELPQALAPLVIEKGSIAVDGVSLTVNAVKGHTFTVNIIPLTSKETTLAGLKVGGRVNLETDIIGKYVARLLGPQVAKTGLTEDLPGEPGVFLTGGKVLRAAAAWPSPLTKKLPRLTVTG